MTIVEKKAFVVKIESQSGRRTRTDWRRDQGRRMYRPGRLSPGTLRKLLEFHRRSGLVYAAYDMIVTKAGKEVFLECNPGGQWLWLERAVGIGITEALASTLVA